MPLKNIVTILCSLLMAALAAAAPVKLADARSAQQAGEGGADCEISIPAVASEINEDSGYWKVAITLRSTGDEHFRGQGFFTLYPAEGGAPLVNETFDVKFLMAGDSIEQFLYSQDAHFKAGKYRMELRLVNAAGDCEQTFTRDLEVAAREAPVRRALRFAAGALLGLVIIGFTLKIRRGRNSRNSYM